MSRKKAIEAAMERLRKASMTEAASENAISVLTAKEEVGLAYESGRIAGLREGARIAEWWHGKGDANALMLAKAAKLAKKREKAKNAARKKS